MRGYLLRMHIDLFKRFALTENVLQAQMRFFYRYVKSQKNWYFQTVYFQYHLRSILFCFAFSTRISLATT